MLAMTVGWRVTGLDTSGPTVSRVAAAARAGEGPDSGRGRGGGGGRREVGADLVPDEVRVAEPHELEAGVLGHAHAGEHVREREVTGTQHHAELEHATPRALRGRSRSEIASARSI